MVDSVLSVVNELLGATLSKSGPYPTSVFPHPQRRAGGHEGEGGKFLFFLRLSTPRWGVIWGTPRVEI